ncbi:MAG: winged helix-turn-helix transcriptional regulator [Methanobacteriota archaeon]|nr:MAG: winged helix-turn-helix transcriptional regulator [Euryarchaeota archaeon]
MVNSDISLSRNILGGGHHAGHVRLLRDVREGTRLLLLLEVTGRRHTRLKSLAEKLDLTVAGVSEYVKAMEAEGLVQHVGGEYRATRRGVEFLQDRFRTLRSFVESSAREMAIIDEASALASEGLSQGDPPSSGTAATAAKRGEVVFVSGLEGIVALRPGKIAIARLAARKAPVEAGRRVLRRARPDIVAVVDLRAKVFASRLAVKSPVEFAAIPAAVEAAQRGLNVLLLCPEERVAEVVAAIEEANARSEDKIPYETLNL